MPAGFAINSVVIGQDPNKLGIEIVVLDADATAKTTREAMARFHTARVNDRIASVVIVAVRDGFAWILPPNAKAALVGPLPADQTGRILQTALDEPTGIGARQRLAQMLGAWEGIAPQDVEQQLMGIQNSGLFASHELRTGVRKRPDWSAACDRAKPLLRLRREELIENLGYTQQPLSAHALVLSSGGVKSQAVALLLEETESFDGDSTRFSVSPVNYAIALASKHGLPWVMILRGSQLRLYPARLELGVGRNSPATTFFEIDLSVVRAEDAGFLTLICAADALGEGGSTSQILATSSQYAVALGSRLRTQVYERIVPLLSVAVAKEYAALGHELDRAGLDLAYRLTLRIFFRLLFQAYAEDHKLLPYGENERYDRNALNTLARDLVDHPDEQFDAESTTLWDDLAQVWRVIDKGDKNWSVPAYNGGLFDVDPELQPEGALLDHMRITNDVMGPVLRAMLIDEADGIVGPIDFRSLSVREFGTIYEGLLESNLAVADTDLVLDADNTWVPAPAGEELDPLRSAPAGTVYFHNTSGQRKGTGSYFTPSFAVQHLLERALDPALAEHLDRVKALLDKDDQTGAADLFFDFRVADIAMGSGHFLTAAIDHIEQGMGTFLVDNPIPGVANELRHLETAAREAAGPDAPEIEPMLLLRRQIARRCIYGLDINPIAVELARVSIWIHTFVRGLPMSSLDHNLVCANSLTGIGTVDEALDVLVPGRQGQGTIFDAAIEDALEQAREMLVDVANAAEATRKEAQDAARASVKARKKAEQARYLFDAAVLRRIGEGHMVASDDPVEIARQAADPEAQALLEPLDVAHMPLLFPEVFLRSKSGFDVLVGNPPWEKLHIEEQSWWWLRFPGLRGMTVRDRQAAILAIRESRPDLVLELENDIATADRTRQLVASGPFPGIGSGHLDLYKAFSWRYWQLLGQDSRIGAVLPRGALSGSGTQEWRRTVLKFGSFADVVFVLNHGHWVFENVHTSYTAALVVAERGGSQHFVRQSGPFHNFADFVARRDDLFETTADEFQTWTATASFPLIPDAASGALFKTLRNGAFISETKSFWFRPVQGDINAATNRDLFDSNLDSPASEIPVFTGSSFNLWEPDFGPPYAWGKPFAEASILAKVVGSSRQRRSAFHGLGIDEVSQLPMHRCRIAFRDVTSPTNQRTTIACLIPPGSILVHKAPYLLRRNGDERDEAFVLGCMSSRPFDWYARRIVELTFSFELLNTIPLPRPDRSDPRWSRVVEIAGRLAARDSRYDDWAAAVGVPVASVALEEQPSLEAELDALVAHLYGLNREQVEHLFATFNRGWDFFPRLAAVLEYFDAIKAPA